MANVLEYFVGGVPAGTIFQLNVKSLHEAIETTDESKAKKTLAEICFIALIAHFEAFCKDHFASLINICPRLVLVLEKKGQNVLINSCNLIDIKGDVLNHLGFILAEGLDFGNARKINSIYAALLSVAPFSKNEQQKYNNILNDRNLLIHHGGVFTRKYARSRLEDKMDKKRVYFDSLVISKRYFEDTTSFLEKIACKLINATKKSLEKFVGDNTLKQDEQLRKAIFFLNWWDE